MGTPGRVSPSQSCPSRPQHAADGWGHPPGCQLPPGSPQPCPDPVGISAGACPSSLQPAPQHAWEVQGHEPMVTGCFGPGCRQGTKAFLLCTFLMAPLRPAPRLPAGKPRRAVSTGLFIWAVHLNPSYLLGKPLSATLPALAASSLEYLLASPCPLPWVPSASWNKYTELPCERLSEKNALSRETLSAFRTDMLDLF